MRDLEQVGSKLNVSKQEIRRIKRARIKERIKSKTLYPIAGATITVCSAIAGFLVGKANPIIVYESGGGYPFAAAGLILIGSRNKGQLRLTAVVTIFASIVGFLIGYKIGQPVYHAAPVYGVYKR